jgi:predicted tellurium resistance membrane protein TerC
MFDWQLFVTAFMVSVALIGFATMGVLLLWSVWQLARDGAEAARESASERRARARRKQFKVLINPDRKP